jgi:hypothetical protein
VYSTDVHACLGASKEASSLDSIWLTKQAWLIALLTTITMNIMKEYIYIYGFYNLLKFISDRTLPPDHFDYEYVYVLLPLSPFSCFFFTTIATYIINSISSFFFTFLSFFSFFGVDQKIWRRRWCASTEEQILFVKFASQLWFAVCFKVACCCGCCYYYYYNHLNIKKRI